jgi:uracil phosphoribosyltransferase
MERPLNSPLPQFTSHHYGSQVFLLNDPFYHSLLARLCQAETYQPTINQAIEVIYRLLLTTAVNNEFQKEIFTTPTRMESDHPDLPLRGTGIKKDQRVVCVDLARAGIYPSQVCYEHLHWVIPPALLRQDHIFASRMTNESHTVVGTQIGSHKIGGDVKGAIVIFPDPMGATGTTIISAVDFYKHTIPGPAQRYLALHLIVTPEYLKHVTEAHPDVVIYALRLDRGLSSQKVLESEPGQFWSQERGLNDNDYIVPGAGGFGEIMNNSFV